MSATVGLVGRMVSVRLTRGDVTTTEICEVVACQTGGADGCWQLLVATREGQLINTSTDRCRLVAVDDAAGPYR